MNNKQFIAELAQRTGCTAPEAQTLMRHLTDAMADVFQEGNMVAVQNFGSFEVKKKMERIIVNPTTGQRMLVPPKLTLAFKISQTWKGKIKSGGTE